MLSSSKAFALILAALAACSVVGAADAPADASLQPYDVTFWVQPRPNEEPVAMVVEIHPEWAPLGAARFRELVDVGYYTDCRFFRSIKKFVAQFGLAADPKMSKEWTGQRIKDDPVVKSNLPGTLTFATSGPDSRTTQLFFNFGDNHGLDRQGFAPFGLVKDESLPVLAKINTQYGEKPSQGKITKEGNKYLVKEFPQLSAIKSIDINKPTAAAPALKAPEVHRAEPKKKPEQSRGASGGLRGSEDDAAHAKRVAAHEKRERLHTSGVGNDDPDHDRFCAGGTCPLFVVMGIVVLLLVVKTRNGSILKGE